MWIYDHVSNQFIHFQFYMIQMRHGSSCNFRLSLLLSFCFSTGFLRLMACPRVPTQGGFDGDLKEECGSIYRSLERDLTRELHL